MSKVKVTPELQATINDYKAVLSNIIDTMVDSSVYVRNQLKSSLNDVVHLYAMNPIDSKILSLDSDSKLDYNVSAILALLRAKIQLYMQAILSNEIHTYSDFITNNETINSDKVNAVNMFLYEKIDDKTFYDRINSYTDNFKYEAEAMAVAGLASGMSAKQIVNEYAKNIDNPYKSELLKEAIRSNEFEARNIKSKGVTYGQGISNSMAVALTLVAQDTIFRFYNKLLHDSWSNDNSIAGWISIRNSSYPCDLCDSQAYVFHPMSEFFMGYHRRCVCLCVPVTKNML